MICKALILGAVSKDFVYKQGEKVGQKGTMKLLSFVDTENPSGVATEVMLDKDEDVAPLAALRMKVANIRLFMNGKYTNFAGIVA